MSSETPARAATASTDVPAYPPSTNSSRAAEHRLPGEDGQSPDVEIPQWTQIGPRYGLEVVGPPIPE